MMTNSYAVAAGIPLGALLIIAGLFWVMFLRKGSR